MKKLLFIILLAPITAYGETPSTACPSGYIQVNEPDVTLNASTCPANFTKTGYAPSCLVSSPEKICYMYIPTSQTFTDDQGTYEYTDICELTL